MSTKSHFIYENGIEGYEEVSEPQNIFGKFTGYNAYLFLEGKILKSFSIKGAYFYVETKNTTHLPEKFEIWGDAILEVMYDGDGLMLHLEGGHHTTKGIIKGEYKTTEE